MSEGDIRYVLALEDDARVVEATDGTAIVERLPTAVLAEAPLALAKKLARDGEYVHVYSSPHDALRAFALFRS